jgi:hypothetical protein
MLLSSHAAQATAAGKATSRLDAGTESYQDVLVSLSAVSAVENSRLPSPSSVA